MWKLMNMVFGWDYIAWENSAANGIARVHTDGTGRAFYWRYWITDCIDVIRCPTDVVWLTCSPDKYIKKVTE